MAIKKSKDLNRIPTLTPTGNKVKVMLSAMIDIDIARKLDVYAKDYSYNKSELVRNIVEEWLTLKENPGTTLITGPHKDLELEAVNEVLDNSVIEQYKKDKELDDSFIKHLTQKNKELQEEVVKLRHQNDLLEKDVKNGNKNECDESKLKGNIKLVIQLLEGFIN